MSFVTSIEKDFEEAGVKIGDVAIWLPEHVVKLGRILEQEKALEPELIAKLTTLLADAATFSALVSRIVDEKGLVWSDDIACINAGQKLIRDLPALIADIEAASKALEA